MATWGPFLYYSDRRAAAFAVCRVAVEVSPKNATAHYNYANLLSVEGEVDKARKHYRRALEINPDDAKVLSNYGLLVDRRQIWMHRQTDHLFRHFIPDRQVH